MAKSKNCFAARCKAESNNDAQFGKANRCLPCVNSVLHLISIAPALTAIASTASHFSTRARPTTPLPRHLLRPGSATPSPHPTRRDPPAPRSTSHELPATTEGARRRRRRRSSLPPPPEELESPELRKGSRSACGTFFPKLPPRATSSSRPAAASTCLHGSTFSRAAAAPGLLPVHRRVRPPPGPPSCPASSRTPLSLSPGWRMPSRREGITIGSLPCLSPFLLEVDWSMHIGEGGGKIAFASSGGLSWTQPKLRTQFQMDGLLDSAGLSLSYVHNSKWMDCWTQLDSA
jgi:hypothetical protein